MYKDIVKTSSTTCPEFLDLKAQVAQMVPRQDIKTTLIYLVSAQSAELIGIEGNTLNKLRKCGYLSHALVRNGRKVLFRTALVLDFVYDQPVRQEHKYIH